MAKVKIRQVIIGPDNSAYQSAMFGVGTDGVVYRAECDHRWYEYFPNRFGVGVYDPNAKPPVKLKGGIKI